MSITFNEIMEIVSDEQLEQSFYDIAEWKKTGELNEDSIIRKVHETYINENYGGRESLFLSFMENVFLFEMAKRYYKSKKNREILNEAIRTYNKYIRSLVSLDDVKEAIYYAEDKLRNECGTYMDTIELMKNNIDEIKSERKE